MLPEYFYFNLHSSVYAAQYTKTSEELLTFFSKVVSYIALKLLSIHLDGKMHRASSSKLSQSLTYIRRKVCYVSRNCLYSTFL